MDTLKIIKKTSFFFSHYLFFFSVYIFFISVSSFFLFQMERKLNGIDVWLSNKEFYVYIFSKVFSSFIICLFFNIDIRFLKREKIKEFFFPASFSWSISLFFWLTLFYNFSLRKFINSFFSFRVIEIVFLVMSATTFYLLEREIYAFFLEKTKEVERKTCLVLSFLLNVFFTIMMTGHQWRKEFAPFLFVQILFYASLLFPQKIHFGIMFFTIILPLHFMGAGLNHYSLIEDSFVSDAIYLPFHQYMSIFFVSIFLVISIFNFFSRSHRESSAN